VSQAGYGPAFNQSAVIKEKLGALKTTAKSVTPIVFTFHH